MTESKDSIEITPEMKAAREKIHDAIGSQEMCPHMRMKDDCGICAAKEFNGMRIALDAMGSIAESREMENQQLIEALSALIYTAERTAELITSASDRYDIDVAIESAKEMLKN